MVDLLDPQEGEVVLDLGCGTGMSHVPDDTLPGVLDRVNELCSPRLFRDGRWYADYVRLRFLAVAETHIGFARVL